MVKDLCFEIIEACPNKCIFCSSNSCMDKKQIISLDDFKRVIDYFINEGGIGELSLSGGEPFLHPDLFKMVEYAKSLDIRTVIFTSGIKMAEPLDENVAAFYTSEMNAKLQEIEMHEPWNERLKNIIRNYYGRLISPPGFSYLTKEDLHRLKEMGLDKIVFDYQAYDAETDKYLMGRNNQSHFCLLNSLRNAAVTGLETDVHFIPMKPNYRQFPDILEMLEIAEVGHASVLNFVPQGRGHDNVAKLMLTDSELEEFKDILEKCESFYNVKVRVSIPLMGDSTHKCNAGLEKLDIKFDGTILPCPAFKELDQETAKRYGIRLYNIYENLEEVKTPGGKRVEPLCRRIYRGKK